MVTPPRLSHCFLLFHKNVFTLLESMACDCELIRCLHTSLTFIRRTILHYCSHLEILLEFRSSCQSLFTSFQQSPVMVIKWKLYQDVASDLVETPFETWFANADFPLLLYHPLVLLNPRSFAWLQRPLYLFPSSFFSKI